MLGGNHRPTAAGPFVKTDLIHAAVIGADGALGAWRQVGRWPSPVTECAAAAWDDTRLVVDGIYDDDAGGLDTVFAAQVRFPIDQPAATRDRR